MTPDEIFTLIRSVGSILTTLGSILGIAAAVYARLAAKRGKQAVATSMTAQSGVTSLLKTVVGVQQQQSDTSTAVNDGMAKLKEQNEQLMTAHLQTLTELRQIQRAGKHAEGGEQPPSQRPAGPEPSPSTQAVWTQLGG